MMENAAKTVFAFISGISLAIAVLNPAKNVNIKQKGATMPQKILQAIQTLRKQNYSYASIAQALGMNANTVKSLCRRSGIETPNIPRKTKAEKRLLQVCKQCGKPIDNPWNRVRKSFCSDHCRTLYWNTAKAKGYEAPKIKAQKGLDSSPHQSYDGAKEVTAYGNTENCAY